MIIGEIHDHAAGVTQYDLADSIGDTGFSGMRRRIKSRSGLTLIDWRVKSPSSPTLPVFSQLTDGLGRSGHSTAIGFSSP
ncbi:MAG: hypothetical protein RQ741_09150 [Wenzhouxiangellaceae bacterium]|nr:hypothetical protein [Wenzhouxiangellaceae bacterium]